MRYFSAQYVVTNTSAPLKRGVVAVADDGTIEDVTGNDGFLSETHSVEYHNGIIIPGFVNCHCHLELSHMHNMIGRGGGLGSFIFELRNIRTAGEDLVGEMARKQDATMWKNGISLCADICNSPSTFSLKKTSPLKYISLLEVFGIDPEKAGRRMDELLSLRDIARSNNIDHQLVPHAAYSMSRTLLKMLLRESGGNNVTSIHFMESPGEAMFLEKLEGSMFESYKSSGFLPAEPELVPGHAQAVLDYITPSGNLILVHNTFCDSETLQAVSQRKNLYWCLCPRSNLYIENALPPVEMLHSKGCDIVLGTDSLASNEGLSIFEELKLLQSEFPSIQLEELIKWGTLNGARALCASAMYGTIEKGKKPGLLLVSNADLLNFRLLPESTVKRLV